MTKQMDQMRQQAIKKAFSELPLEQQVEIATLSDVTIQSIKNEHPKLQIGAITMLEIIASIGMYLNKVCPV